MKISEIDRNTTTEDFLTLKKSELVTFLRSVNSKISGSKADLAKRAFDVNQLNHGLTAHLILDDHDGGSKTDTLLNVSEYTDLKTGWTSNEELFPQICHNGVESYLIESRHRTGDNEKMQCYRQFIKGYNFYKEDYVHDVMVNIIDESCQYCYVRSKCYPSMKQGTYFQCLLISKKKPFVISKANCTCPAGKQRLFDGTSTLVSIAPHKYEYVRRMQGDLNSPPPDDSGLKRCWKNQNNDQHHVYVHYLIVKMWLGEGCTHIACAKQLKDVPCTSKQCCWSKGGKRKRDPQEILNISFKRLKYGKGDVSNTTPAVNNNVKQQQNCDKHDFLLSLTAKLGNVNPAPVLFDLMTPREGYDINDDLNVTNCVEVSTSEHTVQESDEYIDISSIIEKKQVSSGEEFLSLVTKVPPAVIQEIESRTIGQSENVLWLKTRKLRLTSSNFHQIANRKKENVEKLLQNLFRENDTVDVAPLRWGKKHEPIARKKYIAYWKLKHKENIFVRECGIFLCDNCGYLGASPDGLVTKVTQQSVTNQCLLEIKCPWKWRFKSVAEACLDKDFFFCEIDANKDIQLKKSHKFYAQIQGQMGICHFSRCDLVVYVLNDFKIIEIEFDKSYWEEMKTKLMKFYEKFVVPFAICKSSQNVQSES